jgi:transcriptional regulator with XRE-family HTH domain
MSFTFALWGDVKLLTKSVHNRKYGYFLELLIAARKTAGLTQVEVAKRLTRPQSYVSKYENGERRLDVVELLDVAQAINLDPITLLRKLKARTD